MMSGGLHREKVGEDLQTGKWSEVSRSMVRPPSGEKTKQRKQVNEWAGWIGRREGRRWGRGSQRSDGESDGGCRPPRRVYLPSQPASGRPAEIKFLAPASLPSLHLHLELSSRQRPDPVRLHFLHDRPRPRDTVTYVPRCPSPIARCVRPALPMAYVHRPEN